MNITVAEAKAKFSELMKRAEAGEEITVTRHGKAVARVMPPAVPEEPLPRIGALKGKIRIADDFDAPLEQFGEYVK
jgi:prevent-host-death family protein